MDERVLLVEDDASIREVTSLGLRGAGLSVETAADGREALVRFRAEPYDLVVLDVMLPELDGLEVLPGDPPREPRADPDALGPRRHRSTSSSASSSAPTIT